MAQYLKKEIRVASKVIQVVFSHAFLSDCTSLLDILENIT